MSRRLSSPSVWPGRISALIGAPAVNPGVKMHKILIFSLDGTTVFESPHYEAAASFFDGMCSLKAQNRDKVVAFWYNKDGTIESFHIGSYFK